MEEFIKRRYESPYAKLVFAKSDVIVMSATTERELTIVDNGWGFND